MELKVGFPQGYMNQPNSDLSWAIRVPSKISLTCIFTRFNP